MKHARLLLCLAALLFVGLPFPLQARIISYAPVTDRHAQPAVQHRTNRHYLLIESESPFFNFAPGPGIPVPQRRGRLVLYDSRGEQEPRVILPSDGSLTNISFAALREADGEVPRLLIGSDADISGDNPQRSHRFLYSADGGASWRVVAMPAGSSLLPSGSLPDVGGPVVGGRGSQVRIGSAAFPFVVALNTPGVSTGALWAVADNGSARFLASGAISLIGSDVGGTRFLIVGSTASTSLRALRIVDLAGGAIELGTMATMNLTFFEGWITPDSSAYLEDLQARTLFLYRGGTSTQVSQALSGAPTSEPSFFAIPTANYTGAWILQRGIGLPTILWRHEPGESPVEQWRDVAGLRVEALHAGASGRRLLIQVHRPRPQADQRIFLDPALAVWEIGDPAPRSFDELFLNEGPRKGFVHLDVDRISMGAPFVFDSAAVTAPTGVQPSPSPGPGGGDVTQEWGVVRASLRQRLVLPVVARTPGANESFWLTDLIIRNPTAETIVVALRYVPSFPGATGSRDASLELSAGQTRVIPDVLLSLFGFQQGAGALFLEPGDGKAVSVTSRTYTRSSAGTYGMGIGAIDAFAVSSARFPVTFSAALQGSGFRTNLVATDTTGRGASVSLRAAGTSGPTGRDVTFSVPPGGQSQLGGIADLLAVDPHQTGAVVFQPVSGEAIASLIAADNRTNDPTYFPPDLPSPYVRTIPAIVHVDGVNGSRWRTDLFLYNPHSQSRFITLAVKRWDVPEPEVVLNLTLLPRESKTVRDVLRTAFNRTGIARLRYLSGSGADTTGVRVTARTYTELGAGDSRSGPDLAGGTYGFLMPPLNAFQSAGPGETLEILGPTGGAGFRTNLALVDLTGFPDRNAPRIIPVRIHILSDRGTTIDTFETTVPSTGGVQLNDLFRGRGLGDGPEAAVIRVSPSAGVIGAFATTTDNGTNDPVYFAAALASSE